MMKNEFDGAIFEGVLLGAAARTRGSSFGTAYDLPYIPVYDPLNPSNIMTIPGYNGDDDGIAPSP